MLIGFDGSRAFGQDKTGTENYSFNLLLNLAKVDRENNYLVYLRPASQVSKEDWPENFKFKVLPFPRLWTQVGLGLATFRDPLDLLFVTSHTLPVFRKPFLKTVMTVHDLGAEYLPKFHQFKQRLYLGFITKFQLRSASRLIAVSKATEEDIVKRIGINPKKIEVIYEGVNRALFKPIQGVILSNILKQFNLEARTFFLFVGTIQPRKNLERVIEAFAQQKAVEKLILVGKRGWLSSEIYDLPKKLRIEDRIIFLGRIEDKDLSAFYSGAVALLFPSLFEGFGLPILEAFSCGCPVLTSNISSMKEIASKAAILVDPYDINSISNGIKKISKRSARAEFTKKGFKEVEKFDWEATAKQTLKLLNSL